MSAGEVLAPSPLSGWSGEWVDTSGGCWVWCWVRPVAESPNDRWVVSAGSGVGSLTVNGDGLSWVLYGVTGLGDDWAEALGEVDACQYGGEPIADEYVDRLAGEDDEVRAADASAWLHYGMLHAAEIADRIDGGLV